MSSTLRGVVGGALGLGVGRVARAMAEALALGARPERVIAIGDALARALADQGLTVVAVTEQPRHRKKGPPQVVASPDALPFLDGAADALCSAGLPDPALPSFVEWRRVLCDGARVLVATTASALVRRVAPPETIAAQLVHARLIDVEQRHLGATLLSSARVRRWP